METLLKHGDERRSEPKENGGKLVYKKREKFCVKHGWIDLFFVSELAWYRLHFNCDKQHNSGSAVEINALKKAA